ncbi:MULTISPECIES: hypothetical protein [unclassified Streptomyces]|uniref:hypothetical protein n=1 Tax=unclassified Streptomyces TaxID=2593676 RepID=UPI002E0F806F|nr:hypothetical protein OG279_21240 [Streptomyces sp. NBC_01201]
MGIADQFKDKAQELADQAKQHKAGGKRPEARERSAGRPERAQDQAQGRRPEARDRARDAGEQARERSER